MNRKENKIQGRSLPIGIDDFEELVSGGFLFVDKTLLIQEFWNLGAKVVLVTRPRRFGKSVSLSMLKYFFEQTKKSTAHLFTHTKIWEEEKFQELQGSFPVIHLSFKDIKYDSWEDAFAKIKELLIKEIDRVLKPHVSKMSERQRMTYEAFIRETADLPRFAGSLLFVTEVLESVHGSKVLVLIDEYDTPITHAYLRGYYREMAGFLRNLFSEGLKGALSTMKCNKAMTLMVK